MICYLPNVRKYCQIRLILPELCDPKAINRENTNKLFLQINNTRCTITIGFPLKDIFLK